MGSLGLATRWRARLAETLGRWNAATPLFAKIAIPAILIVACATTARVYVVDQQVSQQLQKTYDQQAIAIADGVEAIFRGGGGAATGTELQTYLAYVRQSDSDLVSVRVHALDSAATVIGSSDPSETNASGLVDQSELNAIQRGVSYQDPDDAGLLETVEPIKVGGQLVGAVVVTSTRSRLVAATTAVTFTILIASAIAVAAELGVILLIVGFGVVRRVRRLDRFMAAVEAGGAMPSLPEGQEAPGRDQLFNLGRSLDHMVATVDRRLRWDALIRRLGELTLAGTPAPKMMTAALEGIRDTLGLESCIFISTSSPEVIAVTAQGVDSSMPRFRLPVWVNALSRVAVNAQKPLITDRLGQHSRFVGDTSEPEVSEAVVVPLTRTSTGGEAIVAIAAAGEAVSDEAIALLDSVAAMIAEALRRQDAEAARSEAAVKSRVMATVSHEMRNPLNSILGFLGLVLSGPERNLTEKQRRQLGSVRTSATGMLDLVNAYLEHAKAQSGELSLRVGPVAMEPVVAEAVEQAQPMALAKQLEIRWSVEPGTTARVDAARVRQVLANLLSNAVKFTPEHGRVCVRVRTSGPAVRLAVSDTGVGIPRAQRDRVFTEFPRIDAGAMASAKGTGLGLALARDLTQAMGGTIHFHSRPGRGTTFVVTLPAARPASRMVGAA